jgi:hypothetical protein
MPRTIRFHLDENCPRAVATGLRRRGIDVTTRGLATIRDKPGHFLHDFFTMRLSQQQAAILDAD